MSMFPTRRLSLLALAVGIGCGNGGAKSLDGGPLGGAGGAQATGGGSGAGGVTSTGGIFSDGGVVGPAVDAGPLGAAVQGPRALRHLPCDGCDRHLAGGQRRQRKRRGQRRLPPDRSSRLCRGLPPDPNRTNDVDRQLVAGSRPGASYDVRVRYSDPDGGTLDRGWATATASTRAEIVIPSARPAPCSSRPPERNGLHHGCSMFLVTGARPGAGGRRGSARRRDLLRRRVQPFELGHERGADRDSRRCPRRHSGRCRSVLFHLDARRRWCLHHHRQSTRSAFGVWPAARASIHTLISSQSLPLSASNALILRQMGLRSRCISPADADPTCRAACQVSRYNAPLTISGGFVYVI